MRKIIVFVITVLLISVLAGCASNAKETSTPPASTATQSSAPSTEAPVQSEEATAQADDYSWIVNQDTSLKGTVRFWIPFAGPQGMDAMIADFNKTYPNIEVQLNSYSNNSEGNVAVNTSIIAGEVDVLASFEIVNLMNRMQNGLYTDISSKIAEEGINLVENWGTDVYNYKNSVYVIPNGGVSYYVAINKTAWDEAGLGEIPKQWTWDEYIAASEAMTKKDASGNTVRYGGSNYHIQADQLAPIYQVNGKNRYYNEDGTSVFDSELVAKILDRNITAENAGIWHPTTTYLADNYKPWFAYTDGKVGSVVINNLVRFLRDTATYPVDWVTTFAPYPTEEANQVNYMSGVNYFSFTGIARGAKDVDASWAFLKWFTTHGSKYLTLAGHQATWNGTSIDDVVPLIFGSEADAAKLIDVDAFKSVVGVTDNPSAYDTESAAYAELTGIWNEYSLYAYNGQKTIEEAMTEAAKLANEAIKKAK